MAKLHYFAGVVKLPAISLIRTDGKYIELVFKDRFSVFRYTPSSGVFISDFDIDDLKEDNYVLQKENESPRKSKKFSKRRRNKKTQFCNVADAWRN